MPDAVFDTTVLIDYYRGVDAAGLLLADVAAGVMRAWYAPLTVYELWLRAMDRDEEAFYQSFIFGANELPFTTSAARQVGVWPRDHSRQQRLSLASDAMIAASAAERGLPIFTRNPRDITRFYSNVQSC